LAGEVLEHEHVPTNGWVYRAWCQQRAKAAVLSASLPSHRQPELKRGYFNIFVGTVV
jgi:hypothetical protein